jgi:hypothetical protein
VARDRGRKAKRRGEADSSWVSRAVAYTVLPFGLRGVRTGIGPIWSPSAHGSLWSSAFFSKLDPVLLPVFQFIHRTLVGFTDQSSAKVT